MQNELVVIEAGKELETLTRGVDKLIADIRNKITPAVNDVDTAKGRKEIVSNAYKVTKTKTGLTKVIDDLIKQKESEIQPVLDTIKLLKTNKKDVNEKLSSLQEEVRSVVSEWEKKEEERVAEIMARLKFVEPTDYPFESVNSNDILVYIQDVKNTVIDSSFQEFELRARQSKEKTIELLENMLIKKKKQEDEAVELEKLRNAEIERENAKKEAERIERENKIREEAAASAKLEVEKIAKEQELKLQQEKDAAIIRAQEAEREKIAAEERAKIQIENAKKEAREKEIADANKRAAEEAAFLKEKEDRRQKLEHVNSVQSKIKVELVNLGASTVLAAEIVKALHDNKITQTTINY